MCEGADGVGESGKFPEQKEGQLARKKVQEREVGEETRKGQVSRAE